LRRSISFNISLLVTFFVMNASDMKIVKDKIMKRLFILVYILFIANIAFSQKGESPQKTPIMTLGVFHFAYHNLDVVNTKAKDQISVLEDPYHSEIVNICKAIETFKPTIIAVEALLQRQKELDSLYSLYKSDKYVLKKSEISQIGFRLGKALDISTIHCVNDMGRHYKNVADIFIDSVKMDKFSKFYYNSPDSVYYKGEKSKKVKSIIDELERLNNPERLKERLSVYLLNLFKYEEEQGDFTGVDFETGRWFNRNLRICRNVQRISLNPDDRILLIIGADHLNVLNWLFDVSKEFDLVSPIPYIKMARNSDY